MNVYTKEQLDAIAIEVAQRIKESQAFTINQRTGLPFKQWIGTQVQYDAIPTKDAGTLYMVTA